MEGNALSAWFGFLHDGRCKGLQQGGHMEDPVFKKSKIKNQKSLHAKKKL